MKVRVVDLHRSGLGWEFIPYGVQELNTVDNMEAPVDRLPTLAKMLDTINQEPQHQQSEDAREEGCSADLQGPGQQPAADIQESRKPLATHYEEPETLDIIPDSILHPIIDESQCRPMDFDVEVEVPVTAPIRPLATSPFGEGPEHDFDYFTSPQMSPGGFRDNATAWADEMVPALPHIHPATAKFRLPAPSGAQKHSAEAANPSLPGPQRPQHHFIPPPQPQIPSNPVNILERPAGGYRPPRGPGNYLTAKQQLTKETPEDAAARRARTAAVQAELRAIWAGSYDDRVSVPASFPAIAGGGDGFSGFAAAAKVVGINDSNNRNPLKGLDGNASNVVPNGDEQATLPTAGFFDGSSVEILSLTAAEQLAAIEAKAFADSRAKTRPTEGEVVHERQPALLDHREAKHRRVQLQVEMDSTSGEEGGNAFKGVPEISIPLFLTVHGHVMSVPEEQKLGAARRLLSGDIDHDNCMSPSVNPRFAQVKRERGGDVSSASSHSQEGDEEKEDVLNPGGPPMFTTGLGNEIRISPTKLEAARKLLQGSDGEEEKEEGGEKEEHLHRKIEENIPATSFPVFTTGLGSSIKISEERLAAARQMFADLDEDVSLEPSSPLVTKQTMEADPLSLNDTPTLRRQVLNIQKAAHGAKGKALATTPCPRAAGPSRFALQAHGGSAPRSVRGKFSTPRRIETSHKTLSAADPTTASRHLDRNPRTASRLQHCENKMYDMSVRSKLKEALAAIVSPDVSEEIKKEICFPTSTGAASGSWPLRLPLDSVQAGTHQFVEAGGGTRVGPGDMRARLLASGAKAVYATDEWVRNHYRWVVWKLAKAEFAAGPAAAGRVLTADITEDELRLRYEREFNRGHRPLIKAILHQDEAAGGLAVLMVASIRTSLSDVRSSSGTKALLPNSNGSNNSSPLNNSAALLELTDGWYWIMAQCDAPLTRLVKQGRIGQGTKLRICGAELSASSLPGDPLVAAHSATLRLSANGTHPVHDGHKLGRQGHRTTYTPLRSIHSMGGTVPQTLVIILRRYPTLAWSTLPSGVSTFQTLRARDATDRRFEAMISSVQGAAAAEVQAAEVRRCTQWLRGGKPGGMTQADRWYATMMTSGGGGDEFISTLTTRDRHILEQYTVARQEELRKEQELAMNVRLDAEAPAAGGMRRRSTETISVLLGEVTHSGLHGMSSSRRMNDGQHRACAADTHSVVSVSVPTSSSSNVALCTIWEANEESASIKEGEIYAVMGLEPCGNTKMTPVHKGEGVATPQWRGHPATLHVESRGKTTIWRPIARTLDGLPAALQAREMPRVTLSLATMADFAIRALAPPPGASTDAQTNPHPLRSVFDFTGIVIKAGPVYLASDYTVHYQWVFFADRTITSSKRSSSRSSSAVLAEHDDGPDGIDPEPWLLAVKLQGPEQAIEWFHAEEDSSMDVLVTVRDIELVGQDGEQRVWQAMGGMYSAIVRHMMNHKRGAHLDEDGDNAVWLNENKDFLDNLKVRVSALM